MCWSVQLIPQLIKSYRRKDTAGLSAEMLLVSTRRRSLRPGRVKDEATDRLSSRAQIWIIGGTFLGAYAFLEDLSIPLLIQPQLFCFFAARECLVSIYARSVAPRVRRS